jgi:regulatory protein
VQPGGADLQPRALRWLAQREHSRSELRAKLLRAAARIAQKDQAATDDDASALQTRIDALLDRLQAEGLLSEQRFAESRVRTRALARGARRIEAELAQHGVQLDDAARSALQATELSRALALWQRRFGAPADDARERARQQRFLLARGFPADVVRQVLRRAGMSDTTDDT